MSAAETPRSQSARSKTTTGLLAVLVGLGQIMFQDSALTGTFFLVGIAVVSPLTAAAAALGALVGTLAAQLLRYDPREIRDGIYGYNASLVAMAMLVFHQPSLATFGLIIAGAALTTPLTRAMRDRLPVPAYTTPFIVTTWLALAVARAVEIPAATVPEARAGSGHVSVVSAAVDGISEVMFQASVLTGVLFLVGILLRSWKGAVWALIGSLLGLLTGMKHHASAQNLALGLSGYNAALAAMALSSYRTSVLLPIVGAVLSVTVAELFPPLGLATLTAPFVLACWAVIALDRFDTALIASAPPGAASGRNRATPNGEPSDGLPPDPSR